MRIPCFELEQSRDLLLTSHAGLALVGQLLKKHTQLDRELRSAVAQRHGVSHGDVAKTYLGLLCTGKNDFEAVNNVQQDVFFQRCLGIKAIPSEATLRQRFDRYAPQFLPVLDEANVELLLKAQVPVTPVEEDLVALDIDAMPMDNSGTKKELVSYAYKGFVGYSPLMAYLGQEGWCLAAELRPGSRHGQSEFEYFLDRVLPRARRLLSGRSERLLVRLDSGHDAWENLARFMDEETDFLIKWNPRSEDVTRWLAYAREQEVSFEEVREGLEVAHFSVVQSFTRKGRSYRVRRVMRITELTRRRNGQALLLPEITMEGWWTSLDLAEEAVIRLYGERGTSEQFHSEFKTDLDIERLPSGKFDTNDLVMAFAVMAYNILRMIGQMGLLGELAPVRHRARRRRLKTVIQELMYLATRIVRTGRRWKLQFGSWCSGYKAFEHVYTQLAVP